MSWTEFAYLVVGVYVLLGVPITLVVLGLVEFAREVGRLRRGG